MRKTVGPYHVDLATNRNNKAFFLGVCPSALLALSSFRLHSFTPFQSNYNEAGPLYERSVDILLKALGPDHAAVATALNNRARVLESQVRAVRMFQRLLNPHLFVVQVAGEGSLTVTHPALQDKYDKADPWYIWAIDIAEHTPRLEGLPDGSATGGCCPSVYRD